MKSYIDLLNHVTANGNDREDRTGVGTRGVFGYQWRHNMRDGFPLLTTKKVHLKSIIVELLWFLRGDTNIQFLHDHGVTIWDEWADKDGNLGPVYGKQWRDFFGVDQIARLIHDLRTNPFSRRHIVSAWNPVDVPSMALPPCHTLWQCYVRENEYPTFGCGYVGIRKERELSLHLYARSIDSFLGLPFNIASYALLLSILAKIAGMVPGELVISFGDLHIYQNHFDQVKEQVAREPRSLPSLYISPFDRLENLNPSHFLVEGYNPHPSIKAPIAV